MVGSLQYQRRNYQLHVHVIAAGAQEAVELLAFSDRLREDRALRAAYVKRKQEIIAAEVKDSIDYSITKGSFVKEVISSMK